MSHADRWHPRIVLPRLPGLLAGLVLLGVGIGLMAEAGLGLGPWEVFHQGIARQTGLELGTVSALVGIPVLLAWWPLGERPGAGTLINVVVVGGSTNVALALVPPIAGQLPQLVAMTGGLLMGAAGTALYLTADLGPGPRDGLMTGLHLRYGWSISRARTGIELVVLVAGYLAGGTVGIGTVMFALGVGPLLQLMLRVVDREGRVGRRRRAQRERSGALAE